MRKRKFRTGVFIIGALIFAASTLTAQRSKPKPQAKTPKSVIFAVLGDGKLLEPVAYLNKNKLEAAANGSDESGIISAFNRTYYKAGTNYRLIFGGAAAGTVTVKASNAKSDCSKNIATAVTVSPSTSLKGLVMGLATNSAGKGNAKSFRRKPTAAEKDEIESLVRVEYARQRLTPKLLRYHNLTALDLENDGKPEFVGSYWVEIDRLTRGLLFFIAGQDSGGKYAVGYSEYVVVDQAGVMSGDIKNVDEGVYHELLLDAYDYDGDGTSNIFTYVQSFEGAGFNAYSRSGGKWIKTFEGSNYHCGY